MAASARMRLPSGDKASPTQIRPCSARASYFCYWHGAKGYSGVALHVRKDWRREAARVFTPRVDHGGIESWWRGSGEINVARFGTCERRQDVDSPTAHHDSFRGRTRGVKTGRFSTQSFRTWSATPE